MPCQLIQTAKQAFFRLFHFQILFVLLEPPGSLWRHLIGWLPLLLAPRFPPSARPVDSVDQLLGLAGATSGESRRLLR
jgi:hypothetical protein